MANTESLKHLKDIHLPAPIGWFPLAPGWYLVLALIILGMVALAYVVYRHRKNTLAKKQALRLLAYYQNQYEKDKNTQVTSAHISELLRRVALVYYPRRKVASLHGKAWIEFLNQTAKGVDFKPVQSMLLDAPFKSADTQTLHPLFSRAHQWIKQRSVPCSN